MPASRRRRSWPAPASWSLHYRLHARILPHDRDVRATFGEVAMHVAKPHHAVERRGKSAAGHAAHFPVLREQFRLRHRHDLSRLIADPRHQLLRHASTTSMGDADDDLLADVAALGE